MPKDNHKTSRSGRNVSKRYNRETDCWNCGSSQHLRKECPRPGLLQCSHCRRKGIRTDDCKCLRGQSPSQCSTRFETAVLLNVEGKHVRAVVNTGSQETRIGLGVLEFLKSKRAVNLAKRIITTERGIETLQATDVRMGDQKHLYAVECFVDGRIPKFEMILGFRGLVRLGYRVSVCGQEGRQRQKTSVRRGDEISEQRSRVRDDDEISFLDENEAKRIREWRY